MKNKVKTLLCLVLALAMALSLAACGGGENEEKTPSKKEEDKVNPEFAYVPEFTKVDDQNAEYISFLSADGEKIYCSVERINGEEIPEGAVKEYEHQIDVYKQFLCTMDESGKVQELPAYEIISAENTEEKKNYNGSSRIVTVLPMDDGKLLSVESVSESWYDGPGDVEFGSDQYWENQVYEEKYFARVLNEDGSQISSFPIEIPEYAYISGNGAVLDKDGNLLIGAEMDIIAFNPQGESAYEIKGDNYIERLIALKDGSIYAFGWGEKGPALKEVDTVGKKLGAEIQIDFANEIYPGGEGFDICYTSGLNLYGLNIGEEPVKIFNWMDADINSDSLRNFMIKPNGDITALSSQWNEEDDKMDFELINIVKKPYDSVPHKKELSLAVMWLDQSFKESIIKYNRTNDKYRVIIKDYSEYNTEEDYEAGSKKLLTEIMSGEMPDMLALNGLPYTQLAAKGIIEDIYPFIDADPQLSREDFQQNFFKALEVDGKLCQICPSFGILTAVGSAKVVGSEPGWNYQQFNEALSQMPEGCQPFGPYVSRDDILRIGLAMDMELYADWTTGQCHFDSPEFTELLKFAAGFPKKIDYDSIEYVDTAEALAGGMQMLSTTGVSDFESLQFDSVNFGSDYTYIGFPSASGSGSAFTAGMGYAITKNCSNKDAAWDFLRTLLTEEYQAQSWYGLPTNQHAFDKALKKAMTPEYQKDGDGNFLLDENGDKIPVSHGGMGMPDGTVVEFYAVSQEQADKLMELLNSTEKLWDEGSKLIEIVIADAAPFFEGQKSAEEVSKLIQSKVNIYINEQR